MRYPLLFLILMYHLGCGELALLASEDPIDFSKDVLPILSENCLLCHGPDESAREANLRLDDQQSAFQMRDGIAAVVPNDLQKSELYARVTHTDPDLKMPPPDQPHQLTGGEIETLKRWILQGAAWSNHWAFVPPVRPKLPIIRNLHDAESDERHSRWQQNPIDAFILSKLQSKKLEPTPEADRFTLIRRATLTLTGLPPTPAEVNQFIHDQSPDAYEQLVDRLLNSVRYGEHMAFDWLDAARYADTSGYQADWERFMWPWRDWVVDAFNRNIPFDQFTIEQLAGDQLPDASLSQILATGFNRNHRINDEGGSLDAEFEVEYVVDRVDTTATIWLGLTAGCARCHDHKYDPLSQREFYQLYAFFNNVPEKGIDGRRGYARPHIEVPNRIVGRRLARLEQKVESLSQDNDSDVNQAESLKKQIDELKKKATTPVMVMQELPKRKATYLLNRGQYDQPNKSEEIDPLLPKVFLDGKSEDAGPKDRLQLAKWLVSQDNPLAARVTVNRMWQHHFGTGLVKTSEDFGTRGDRPSHPKLLDWLATEFVRRNWDMKAMHRLIVTSATFRQSSRTHAQLQRSDPENRLLARGPRLRLSGPAIRDQALAISGLWAKQIGGPTVKPYQPEGLWKELSFGTGKTSVDFYVQDHGSRLYRRSLYTFWKRTVAPPRMAIFDGGGREMCRVRSGRTNTPLQALTLQNDVTFVEAARHLAERMIRHSADTNLNLQFGWQLAVTRPPTNDEMTVLKSGLQRYRDAFKQQPNDAAKLLSFGESKRDDQIDIITHAAHTMIALSLLNLDETITRE